MALIECPECKKQVSSKAKSCPGCGCPIDNSEPSNLPFRPNLSDDLSIGSQVVNWFGDASIKGYFDPLLNSDQNIPEGKGNLLLHKKGIRVLGCLFAPTVDLHFSQLINIECVPRSKIYESDKSVIKRAVVGTILLGPLGGIVGGMSGIGSKKKYISSIIINYWDIKSDSPYTLLLSTDEESTAKSFCDKVNKLIADRTNQ